MSNNQFFTGNQPLSSCLLWTDTKADDQSASSKRQSSLSSGLQPINPHSIYSNPNLKQANFSYIPALESQVTMTLQAGRLTLLSWMLGLSDVDFQRKIQRWLEQHARSHPMYELVCLTQQSIAGKIQLQTQQRNASKQRLRRRQRLAGANKSIDRRDKQRSSIDVRSGFTRTLH